MTNTPNTACPCLTCSGYCACGLLGHHDTPNTSVDEDALVYKLWAIVKNDSLASSRLSSPSHYTRAAIKAHLQEAVVAAQAQMRLHVLSVLKAEADRQYGNPKQLIYTEQQKAWDDLKALQTNTERKDGEL